jgi:hypothetical protein
MSLTALVQFTHPFNLLPCDELRAGQSPGFWAWTREMAGRIRQADILGRDYRGVQSRGGVIGGAPTGRCLPVVCLVVCSGSGLCSRAADALAYHCRRVAHPVECRLVHIPGYERGVPKCAAISVSSFRDVGCLLVTDYGRERRDQHDIVLDVKGYSFSVNTGALHRIGPKLFDSIR